MSDVCARCLARFPHHLVVRARCTRRWRGANFDAAAAEGNVGAAVARALGVDVSGKGGFEALLRRAFVRAFGERRDVAAEVEDPERGEAFEFHVGLRDATDAALVERVEAAAREAVARSRHFQLD